MKIDVGGGTQPVEGCINLDPEHGEGIWKRMVQDGIPCEDGTVDAVFASHVLEHIPAGDERIFVFNEVHRVLKDGGKFGIRVPLFPSWQAVADPTHVSFFVKESFNYFTGTSEENANYGIKPWEMASFFVKGGWEAYVNLVKR